MISFVDPRLRHDAVCVCTDGSFDMVFCRGEVSAEGGGGGDVFGAGEEGVVVCVGVFGDGVEGEVEAGFVAHG